MTEIITPSPHLESKKRKFEEQKEDDIPEKKRRKFGKIKQREFIGPYIILNLLGEGEYGKIYRAKDSKTEKTVAIKKIKLDNVNDMEIKNLTTLAKDCSQYFLCLITTLKDDKYLYIVTEYLDAYITLDDFIRQKPTYDPLILETKHQDRISLENKIACNLTKAIEKLHALDIIHGDLHTENIMVNPKTGQVKLIDYGMSSDYVSNFRLGFEQDKFQSIILDIIREYNTLNDLTPRMLRRNQIWKDTKYLSSNIKKYICDDLEPFP